MSDVLLPFVLLMEDDALAFWCFVSLMQLQGLRRNFAADESGIFAQLRCLGQVGAQQLGRLGFLDQDKVIRCRVTGSVGAYACTGASVAAGACATAAADYVRMVWSR
jgi:hypothetical protein